MKMKPHPFANIFPLLEGEPFDNLVADIKANGLLQAITIHGNMVLDGRDRLRACEAAGIEPRFVEYGGGDPLSFVLSQNLHRRHLDESQRAMIAAKLANMPAHRPADKSANLRTSQSEAAAKLNVSERTVSSAVGVRAYATPELIEAVEQGKIKVSVAEALLGAPKAAQRQAVAAPDRAHVLAKQHRRRIREHQLAGKQLAWGRQEIFGVIYADPPYSTMTLDDIKALPVPATSDCVQFLWATPPMLPQALEVMAAWGFTYVTQVIWDKNADDGHDYWFINRHETLLVGKKGKIPTPASGTQQRSMIKAPVGRHSAKPESFYRLIEEYFPNLPKIDLFARGKMRPDWAAWGAGAE
jgi:N6-adenosine-specific RNA methylase IME4